MVKDNARDRQKASSGHVNYILDLRTEAVDKPSSLPRINLWTLP